MVVGVAAIFGVLGMIGRADPDPSLDIADGTEEPADNEPDRSDEAADEDPPSDDDGPADGAEDAPEASPPEDGDGEPPADADEGSSDDDPEDQDSADDPDDEPDDESDDESDDETDDEPAAPDPEIDPASVSVQVLDGYRQDGGAAADEVYGQLDSAGYDIIARNPAIAYEVTTVLWTAGHEAEGRQVAQEIGAAEVREQPGNLSTEVNVHVVVGADRG